MLNNLAAHAARALGLTELVLWNSDVFAPSGEVFERLLARHREGGHTITGTRLVYPMRPWGQGAIPSPVASRHAAGVGEPWRGTIQFGGPAFLHASVSGIQTYLPFHAGRFLPANHHRASWDGPALFVTGAFSIVDLEWLVAAGGLNPSLARTLQDADLCLRAVEQGRKVMYLGKDLFLLHDEAQTMGQAGIEDPQLASDQLLYAALWKAKRLEPLLVGAAATSEPAFVGAAATSEPAAPESTS